MQRRLETADLQVGKAQAAVAAQGPDLRVRHATHRASAHPGALPLLSVRHPVPDLRYRGGVPVPLGGELRGHRPGGLL